MFEELVETLRGYFGEIIEIKPSNLYQSKNPILKRLTITYRHAGRLTTQDWLIDIKKGEPVNYSY